MLVNGKDFVTQKANQHEIGFRAVPLVTVSVKRTIFEPTYSLDNDFIRQQKQTENYSL